MSLVLCDIESPFRSRTFAPSESVPLRHCSCLRWEIPCHNSLWHYLRTLARCWAAGLNPPKLIGKAPPRLTDSCCHHHHHHCSFRCPSAALFEIWLRISVTCEFLAEGARSRNLACFASPQSQSSDFESQVGQWSRHKGRAYASRCHWPVAQVLITRRVTDVHVSGCTFTA